MSEKTETSPGQKVLVWWHKHIRPSEDTGAARALRARLRRAKTVEALSEPQVHALYDLLNRQPGPQALAALVQVLAHVEKHDGQRLAKKFGEGESNKALSPLRFQTLIRTEDREGLATGLRRALPLVGKACNVAALAEDILFWGEQVKIRWCFEYYGAPAPKQGPAATEDLEDVA